MDAWIEALKKELGITTEIDETLILNVARDAAHAVERPAAPITTYLLGFAAALGANVQTAAETIEKMAKQWPTSE